MTSPFGGNNDFMRFMCTVAFSRLLQCLMYMEYCIMAKPSSISPFRKRVAFFRSVFVSVGKSKNTNTHKILYWFKRLLLILMYYTAVFILSKFGINQFPGLSPKTFLQRSRCSLCSHHQRTGASIDLNIHGSNPQQFSFMING